MGDMRLDRDWYWQDTDGPNCDTYRVSDGSIAVLPKGVTRYMTLYEGDPTADDSTIIMTCFDTEEYDERFYDWAGFCPSHEYAAVICAAPALLRACKAMLAAIDQPAEVIAKAIQVTREAVAKAEGRRCDYSIAWVGPCGQPAIMGDKCGKHAESKCHSCGEPATRECDFTGAFVCGIPLCDDCAHGPAKGFGGMEGGHHRKAEGVTS